MKAYDIPVSKAAVKMLKRDFGYKGFFAFSGQHLTYNTRKHSKIKKYLENTEEHQQRITIISRYCNPARLYRLAMTIEHTFEQTLLLYIETAVEHGMPAAEAISRFMDKYDLSEEDLKMETAYKRWQRYVKNEKERQLIPLW